MSKNGVPVWWANDHGMVDTFTDEPDESALSSTPYVLKRHYDALKKKCDELQRHQSVSSTLREVSGWGSDGNWARLLLRPNNDELLDEMRSNLLSRDEVDQVFSEMRRRGVELNVGTDGEDGPATMKVKIDGRLVMWQRAPYDEEA